MHDDQQGHLLDSASQNLALLLKYELQSKCRSFQICSPQKPVLEYASNVALLPVCVKASTLETIELWAVVQHSLGSNIAMKYEPVSDDYRSPICALDGQRLDWLMRPLKEEREQGTSCTHTTHTLQPIHSLFALPLANVSANTSTGPTSLTYHLPIRLLAGLSNPRGITIHTPNIYALNLTVLVNDTAPHIESRPHTLTPGDLTMIKLISLIEQAQSRPHAVHKPWRVLGWKSDQTCQRFNQIQLWFN